MKLNAGRFGIAGGFTVSLVYGSFVTMIKMWPIETLKFISSTHFLPRLEMLAPYIKITPSNIMLGVLSHGAVAFLLFWIFATIYNILQR
jgi:hypothetical protein